MYFDPISGWLVALLVDGAIVLSEKTCNGNGNDFARKEIADMNENLNNEIRRIKEKMGFISPERQLEEIKRKINNANKSSAAIQWGGDIIIAKDNQEYILELLEACVKKYRDDVSHHTDNSKLMENAKANADRYQELLDRVSKYQVMRYEVEYTDNMNNHPQSDDNIGCLGLILIGVAAVLCIFGIISIIF